MVLLVCPLVRFGLPAAQAATVTAASQVATRKGRAFALLVTAIALNSFVTFGVDALGIELLQAMAAELYAVITIASALGADQAACQS